MNAHTRHHHLQLPTQQPDHFGPYGNAWRFDLKTILADSPAPIADLQICAWAVYAPQSHPAWPCVAVSCISLRDLPGVPPAKLYLAGATHEVIVMALNPDVPLRLDQHPTYLHPKNYAGQFIAASDDEARERVDQAVRDICAGTLNPDVDGRHQWAERFGRAMFKPEADVPDFLGLKPDGGLVAMGMGAANVTALVDLVEKQATLAADEGKPQ